MSYVKLSKKDCNMFFRDIEEANITSEEIQSFVSENQEDLFHHMITTIIDIYPKYPSDFKILLKDVLSYMKKPNILNYDGVPRVLELLSIQFIDILKIFLKSGCSLTAGTYEITKIINRLVEQGFLRDQDFVDLVFSDYRIVNKMSFSPQRITDLHTMNCNYAIVLYHRLKGIKLIDNLELVYKVIQESDDYTFSFMLEEGLNINSRIFEGTSVRNTIELNESHKLFVQLFLSNPREIDLSILEIYVQKGYFKNLTLNHYKQIVNLRNIAKGKMANVLDSIINKNKAIAKKLAKKR